MARGHGHISPTHPTKWYTKGGGRCHSPAFVSTGLVHLCPFPIGSALLCSPGEVQGLFFLVLQPVEGDSYTPSLILGPALQTTLGGKEYLGRASFPNPCGYMANKHGWDQDSYSHALHEAFPAPVTKKDQLYLVAHVKCSADSPTVS